MITTQDIYRALRQVIDPEIPLNIVDLGLIVGVELDGGDCRVAMTLTSRDCPMAQTFPEVVGRVVGKLEGVESVKVSVVWEPAWSTDRITPEGRAVLDKAADFRKGAED